MIEYGQPVLEKALAEGYAVGAFNANNLEMVDGVVAAADQLKAPVIVQVSPGAIKYAGLKPAASLVRVLAEATEVPIVLHLDHGLDFETNQTCAQAGFTSLMYDGSEILLSRRLEEAGTKMAGDLPFNVLVEAVQSEKALALNIAETKKVVEMAHSFDPPIPVEGEIGRIPAIEDFFTADERAVMRSNPDDAEVVIGIWKRCGDRVEALMATPEQAEIFVRETGVDSLAVAIGSIHRIWKDMWPIRIDRLQAIHERVPCVPLVSHGSSGILRTQADVKRVGIALSPGQGTIEQATKYGLAKVNVATAISVALLDGIKAALAKTPQETDFRKIFAPGRNNIRAKVAEYIELLGSAAKA